MYVIKDRNSHRFMPTQSLIPWLIKTLNPDFWKENKTIRDTLDKRYSNILARAYKSKSEDVFEIFMKIETKAELDRWLDTISKSDTTQD